MNSNNTPIRLTATHLAVMALISLLLVYGLFAVAALLMGVQGGLGGLFSGLFSLESGRVFWYITRSAGIMAYLLLWFSTLWGFLLASKIFGSVLTGTYSFDFHEFISLLSLFFMTVHILPLLFDTFQPFSLPELLIPFVSSYKTFWVANGIISFYIAIIVTLSFYLRQRLSKKAFGIIHASSILGYITVLVHGVFTGADSQNLIVRQMYLWSALLLVFFGSFWYIQKRLSESKPEEPTKGSRNPYPSKLRKA